MPRKRKRPTKANLDEKVTLPTERDPDEAMRDLLNVKREKPTSGQSKK